MNPTDYAHLELKNCTFSYFYREYEALVYVENNNMEIQNITAIENPADPKNLMVYGDDRGANISVIESTFKNSRFCKGLIVYEKLPDLETDSSNAIINLANEYNNRYPFDVVSTPSIIVKSSSFSNLDMFQTITKLSYGAKNGTIAGLPTIEYPYSDNHGSVVNIQGFPGEVMIYNNTIEKNLAYIPAAQTFRQDYREPIDFSSFLDSEHGQVYICSSLQYRFFTEYLKSYIEQPSETLN